MKAMYGTPHVFDWDRAYEQMEEAVDRAAKLKPIINLTTDELHAEAILGRAMREEIRKAEQEAGRLGLAGPGPVHVRMAESIRLLRKTIESTIASEFPRSTNLESVARECVDASTDLDAQDDDYWATVRSVQGIIERYVAAEVRAAHAVMTLTDPNKAEE